MAMTQINHEIDITKPDTDCIAVALLSKTAQIQVESLLLRISEKLGDIIWPMPIDALHITLCEIIQPKTYIEDKTELLKNVPHYAAVLEKILSIPAIGVLFNSVEISPDAIIIRGKDDGSFNHIRNQLVSMLPLPAETKAPPNIIHCSIARFRKEIEVDDVRAAIADVAINFKESVDEIQLLSETAPHLLDYSIARRFYLK